MIWLWLTVFVLAVFFGAVTFRGAPYVPSQKYYINQALTDLYKLSDKDLLVDIGSGDGVVLRVASKLGARAVGYEINPILVFISRFLSRKDKKVSVRLADFWFSRLPDGTTVVYVFSVKRDMKKLIKWVQNETNRLGHPVFVISLGFELGDEKPVRDAGAYHLYQFHSLQ